MPENVNAGNRLELEARWARRPRGAWAVKEDGRTWLVYSLETERPVAWCMFEAEARAIAAAPELLELVAETRDEAMEWELGFTRSRIEDLEKEVEEAMRDEGREEGARRAAERRVKELEEQVAELQEELEESTLGGAL